MIKFLKTYQVYLLSLLTVVVIFAFFFTALIITQNQLVNRVLPRTYASSISLDYKTEEEAKKILQEHIDKYLGEPLIFEFNEVKYAISPKKFNLEFDIERTLKELGFGTSEMDLLELIQSITTVKSLEIEYSYDEDLLIGAIREHIPHFQNDPINPKFKFEGEEIIITNPIDGNEVDKKQLKEVLENNLRNLNKEQIALVSKVAKPTIKKDLLEENKETLLSLLDTSLALNHNSHSWTFNPLENLDLIDFKEGPGLSEKTSAEIEFSIDYDSLKNFLSNQNVNQTIEIAPGKVNISRDQNENIVFDGQAGFGKEINYQETSNNIAESLNTEEKAAEISINKIPSELEISEDLQKLGIKDLLATGYSTYYGSPANRAHNIRVGLDKYNGVLIAPGSTFSFNEWLGPVDASTGYKPELVITAGGTLPEYGGGLCQVSTTVYRGVLEAGFPIVERSPHSYAVSYYAQVDGHGLDSTIYPGVKDLQFLNDTEGHILLQTSIVDTYEAYVNIYGTSDGRETWLEGPFISNYRYPGPTQTIETDTLAPGVQKWVEKSHVGFDANWKRFIKRSDGTIEEELLLTTYRAIPAKVMVGAGAEGEEASEEATE